MKKSNPRKTLIIRLIHALVAMTVLIPISKNHKQTPQNTIPCTATVVSVQVPEPEELNFLEITTEEYIPPLLIFPNLYNHINLEDVKNLKCGQTIFFSVEDDYAHEMNKGNFLTITSLKTEDKEILSLDVYNQYMLEGVFTARVTCIIFASIFFGLSLASLITILRTRKNT